MSSRNSICPHCNRPRQRCQCKEAQAGRRFASTRQWQRLSKLHLAEFPLCALCQAEGRITLASITDHYQPHKGNPAVQWDWDNLVSLCIHHHNTKSAREK